MIPSKVSFGLNHRHGLFGGADGVANDGEVFGETIKDFGGAEKFDYIYLFLNKHF